MLLIRISKHGRLIFYYKVTQYFLLLITLKKRRGRNKQIPFGSERMY